MPTTSAEAQLAKCIAKYEPAIVALARAALSTMRKLLPGALELVYDNYNARAIAFGPTERTPDVICSITLYPRWVSLFFRRGAELPDPLKLLKGSGSTVRHIVLDSAATLDEPAVRALIAQAVARAPQPLDRTQRRRVVIKLQVANPRPRRPASRH